MFFKKHTKQQDSKSSTSSQSSSTESSSSQGGGSVLRDSTTAMPMSVNSMRTWEVQNKQQRQQHQEQQLRLGAHTSLARAGTNWDQKNEDLERRAQGLPPRSRSMERNWKNRTVNGPGLGTYS